MSGPGTMRPERLKDIDPDEVYPISEIMPVTKIKRRTLYEFCASGVYPNAVKIGRSWYVPGCDIIALYPHLHRAADATSQSADEPSSA